MKNDLGKEPTSSEITPESLYLRRREFIKNGLLFAATSAEIGRASCRERV